MHEVQFSMIDQWHADQEIRHVVCQKRFRQALNLNTSHQLAITTYVTHNCSTLLTLRFRNSQYCV
jgi:hypothetical protein